jgi:IS30 family transposase
VLKVEDWAEIRRLHRAEGMPIKEIARRLGVARNTVRALGRDLLLHHAEVFTLTGDSYRTRARRELLAKGRAGRE